MSLNILVVDDSSVMRSMIVKTIGMTGIPVGDIYQAGNGKDGIDTLKAHWIDLVIVDINMPVMTGEEMLEHMKQDPELGEIPVIVVSTEGSNTRIERIKDKGAKFIHKPFSAESFRDAIEEITGLGDALHD